MTTGTVSCMTTGCQKSMKNASHGHCRTHYKMLLALVKSGQVTWEELETAGKAIPAKFTRDGESRKLLENFLAN